MLLILDRVLEESLEEFHNKTIVSLVDVPGEEFGLNPHKKLHICKQAYFKSGSQAYS